MKRAVFLSLILLAACSRAPVAPLPVQETQPCKLGIPEKGAYTGAYIDFGDSEDDVTLEKIEDFENLVGKHQAIIASSSFWGEQSFPLQNLQIITRHGAVPLVFWSPWDRPYDQSRPPDRFNLNAILAGKWDAYIDHWADQARDFKLPILVSWGLEMNGTWFPWSGWYYGAKKKIPNTKPVQYMGPETYKKAYRYVVDRVRARGVKNISWVFHANNYSYPMDNWNLVKQYYPGSDYVDWLGLSCYGMQFSDDFWVYFHDVIDYPYYEIGELDPTKPIMLAEWGVGEFPKYGSKAAFLRDAFTSMSQYYPRLKAAVFWNERWQNENDSYSNLRVNSSSGALEAYRTGVKDSFWLDKPILLPIK